MSVFKVQVDHLPAVTKVKISSATIVDFLLSHEIELPVGLLDAFGEYFTCSLDDWGKVLNYLVFDSKLYEKGIRDCDWYALKAKVICEELFGLNTIAFIIGDTPLGRHAWDLIIHPEGVLCFEPNSGYSFSGTFFEIGKHDYIPKLALI